MAYFNSFYFARLSFDAWQKGQNNMLVDYRRFKENALDPGLMLANALRWELPDFRDTCIEQILLLKGL